MRSIKVLFITIISTVSLFSRAASAAETSGDSNVGDKWALVIGISQFKDPSINQLKYAAKDANDFAQYLVNKAHFAPDHVKLITNEQATQRHILSELGSRWLPHVAAPDDLVVLFISSHGSPTDMDIQGVNYIVAYDSDPNDLYTTAIEMQDLVSTISRRIHANRLVVFLDTCHSGAADTGAKGLKRVSNIDLSQVPLGNGQIVISSSESKQVSWESKEHPNGAFTYCLLDTLSKKKDATIPEVFKGLQDSVQQTVLRERGALQTPILKSTWKGNPVSLAVVPSNPHPGLQESPASSSEQISTPPATSKVPRGAISAPEHVYQGSVEKRQLPDNIAIIPSGPPIKVAIQEIPSNVKVVWGQLKSAAELNGLPTKLSESMFHDLRPKYSSRVLGPQVTRDEFAESQIDPYGAPAWNTIDWQNAGKALQARYLISATIDEVDWSTSMMANKYTMVVSARLISGESGQTLSEVKALRIHKAPFQGDVGGARNYFENVLAPTAARELLKSFRSVLDSH